MSIIVKEVNNKKLIKNFIDYPNKLYKDNPYYVPSFVDDDLALFNPKKNPYLKSCQTVGLLVFEDDKIMGRLFGIIQPLDELEGHQKRCRFFYLDTANNLLTFCALFDYLKKWAKDRGCFNLVGPLGFNDTDREGLLIEGFDSRGTFASIYNYPYYLDLMENYGFHKDIDWLQYRLFLSDTQFLDRLTSISQRLQETKGFKFIRFKNTNEVVKKYGYKLFDLINETYSPLYGVVKIEQEIIDLLLKKFKLIVSKELLILVADKNDQIVAFSICFPHISKALQKTKGRLFPFGFIRLLHAIKHYDVVDLGLMGVSDKYKNMGLNAMMMNELGKGFKRHKVKYLETNLMLENNEKILSQMGHLPRENHKKNRSYLLDI
ncbi:MAG: hypothetical protein LBV55_02275 [Acholeplasmatales bacterium]|nr:hypothetical protein [Acholeplasmatales bacterium]